MMSIISSNTVTILAVTLAVFISRHACGVFIDVKESFDRSPLDPESRKSWIRLLKMSDFLMQSIIILAALAVIFKSHK